MRETSAEQTETHEKFGLTADIADYKKNAVVNYDRNLERIMESPTILPPDAVYERMQANYNLIENLDPIPLEAPTMTICIPVDLKNEDPNMVAELVERIQNASGDSNYEVLFWINAKSDESLTSEQREKYIEFTTAISKVEHSRLTLRTALQILPEGTATISNIRANYMEAVAIDAEKRGFQQDHPVLWLDADTTFISKDSLKSLADSIRSGESAFVHANLQYSADWANGVPLDELDDATKAIVANEIHRRQGRRGLDPRRARDEYVEESGLGFSISTYLKAGGVNRDDPVNESAFLMYKFDRNCPDETKFQYSKFFMKIPSSRIGTSARRHYELVKRYGADILYDPDGEGYGAGGLYSGMDKTNDQKPIAREDMQRLFRRQELMQGSVQRWIRHAATNDRRLEKFFKSKNEAADEDQKAA